jgi:putative acetyltransferase
MVMTGQLIAVDDPNRPDVRTLLERHRAFALGQTPPEHSFALDADALRDPVVTFFSFRESGRLLGIGAIKRLGPAPVRPRHEQTSRGTSRYRAAGLS